jgi:hypothetical protein
VILASQNLAGPPPGKDNRQAMVLPGRLRSTSLGDLLGALHRGEATGTLELVEDRGRVHRVFLTQGLVVAVELDGESPSLAEILRRDRAADDAVLRLSLLRSLASQRLHGDVLVTEFQVSPSVVGNALRRQLLLRLEAIEQLPDARVCFRVAVRPPRGSLAGWAPRRVDRATSYAGPGPHAFLHGRRRARERAAPVPSPGAPSSAWRILGVAQGAEMAEIKRAYRRLARSLHPDLHPEATEEQRRDLAAKFSEVTDAYRVLT